MRRIPIALGALCLTLAAACAQAQDRKPTRPPELQKLDVWIGSWNLSGVARDQPDGREYSLHWQLHEHWVLNGFFLQVDQIWDGNGQVLHGLEMLSYDTRKKIYTDSGFGGDGSTWSLTATFHDDATMLESGESLGSDGSITRCRMTWVFDKDGRSLAGREECDRNGTRWKAVDVRGMKSGLTR